MIEKIQIRNFQSHEDSVLHLHKGVNVILGRTDSGKTAAMRAIKWAIQNSPAGDAFRSTWCGKDDSTFVELSFKEGNVVRRSIEKGKNTYYLNKSKFVAFGAKTPKEISDVINLDDINIQQQHDSHFLLTSTPGQVASFFNKIANIDVIDTSNAYLKSKISKIKQNVQFQKDSLKSKKKQLLKYSNLKEIEEKISELEQLQIKRDKKEKATKQISFLLIRANNINSRIKELEEFVKYEDSVNSILALQQEKEEKEKSIRALKSKVLKIERINTQIKEKEEILVHEATVNNILQLIEEKTKIQAKSSGLVILVNKLQAVERKLLKMQDNLKKLENTFHKYMPEECPLCGTELKK